ncbi:uncharacterized protein BT62DRAFT_936586 [Guyanagaster necrorhizus]|uniref:Uncharacterized protein n=1 Tax=Guyanagaster necrorhizus TaxID=856835 RepID=A0A9P7VJU4_9AGAR|nr:uncharacterized protein BT62DRAFT_936586 [Guyanagaster necrorhizus MCA 3950]KAG7441947.1 hypothetical protein BT62DRAFT_936586 [Guyanagaster necrorhizus MCA 3950]
MANWVDLIALLVTVTICGGIVYGILHASSCLSASVASTKAKLQEKGYTISHTGVSVKTSKRFCREDYVDATQRGVIKAMGAASFGSSPSGSPTLSPPLMKRNPSSASVNSLDERKRRAIFSRNRKD